MAGEYLESYADVSVHRLMLDDKPRTLAYRNAILGNKSLIAGKVVMDVGCGSGILSVYCAQAGARKIHAVESSSFARLARKVIADNGYGPIVEVHQCPVEDLVLDEKVDIIVSEWMGFYLLHEGMLPSVIFARDKFLAPGGIMFPESAELWVAACELPQYFDYWKDVCGVQMEAIGEFDRESRKEPAVTIVKPEHLLTEPSTLATFSLDTVTVDQLKRITDKIIAPAKRSGCYQGICIWFIVSFPSENGEYHFLSTAPGAPDTHWQQTAAILPIQLQVEEKQPIALEIALQSRDDDPRKYNMEVTMLDPETEEHPTPCECYMTKCIVIRTYMEKAMDMENAIEEEEPEN